MREFKKTYSESYVMLVLCHVNSISSCTGWVAVKLSALPDDDGDVATKEHVQNVLDLVCDFKAKPFTNDNLPCRSELLVHRLFDHLGSSLVCKSQT